VLGAVALALLHILWHGREQRWVIAIRTKIQLPNTLPMILTLTVKSR